MNNQPLNFAGTGGKTGALHELSTLILPVREQALRTLLYDDVAPADRSQLLTHVGELTLFRAELDAHGKALLLADLACQHGIAGTEPDNWAAWGGGEAYDAHQKVMSALEWAPGRGTGLSAALLAFFEALPDLSREEFAVGLMHATTMLPIPSFRHLEASESPAITPDEVAHHAQGVATDIIEKTLFLTSYAHELAQALELAKAGGDFAAIARLVA